MNESHPLPETPAEEPQPTEEAPSEEAPTPQPETLPPPEETPSPPKKPSLGERFKGFLRRLLRWAVGFAVIFALGVFTSHFAVTLPLRAELAARKDQLSSLQSQLDEVSSELERSQAQVTELRTELSSAQASIEALQSELDAANLHAALFSALADVTRARLALALNDTDAVRQHLANTPQTLNQIATYLEARDTQTVQALSERLAQVLDELDGNPFAAQSDLDVLANDLIQLEKQYFSSR